MNSEGNKDIAACGTNTQFGQPGAPARSSGDAAWSIRKAMRRMAAIKIDPTDPQALEKVLGNEATPAQIAAARCLTRAMQGDLRAIAFAVDNIEGKLPQSTINAELEAIKNMTDDELRAEIARLMPLIMGDTQPETDNQE